MRRRIRNLLRRTIPPRVRGFLDVADCQMISGWAWDALQPHRRLTVEVFDGPNLVTIVAADRHRPDLEAAGYGDGAHGFRMPMPDSLKDGKLHVLWARAAGTKYNLRGCPRRVMCQPTGDDLLVGSRSVSPVSRRWGMERGIPLDRHYIESFLARYSADIRGRVLEIGNNAYTMRFGADKVAASDVLNVMDGVPGTTIVDDLTDGRNIPSDAFDAAIVTETLQLIYDVRAAIRTLHRMLKPGGVVLITVPGITPMGDIEWGHSWYWSFTTLSIRALFEEYFRSENVTVESHGNVLAAASFLYGLTGEDLTLQELEVHDPYYPVTVTVRAAKEGAPSDKPRPDRVTGAASLTRPATVLLYHRVATTVSDPWLNSIDPTRFVEHLDALNATAKVVPLSEFENAAKNGGRRPTVAVTFDDGYEDNVSAHAELTRRGLPATYFVVSGNLGREFWWDELERLLLRPGVVEPMLRLTIKGESRTWDLRETVTYTRADYERNAVWRDNAGMPEPTARHSVLRSLHALLMRLSASDRAEALQQVRECVRSSEDPEHAPRAMSAAQLQSLASDPHAEIGAHTVTHPALPWRRADERRQEIGGSKDMLEEVLGRPIRFFAYPFGRSDAITAAMVRAAGFDRAWAIGDPLAHGYDDQMELSRLPVEHWSGDELARRISRIDW